MSGNVLELYQETVRPMPEQERLELVALIINDLARQRAANGEEKQNWQKLSALFGSASLGYATGVDNEQIDADLASEYANTHEDEK